MKLLDACVVLVIEILPASRAVLTYRLHPPICRRVDEHVRPRGRNFQVINPVEIGFRETTALWFVAKSSFRSAESTYADVLETFDNCHWLGRAVLPGNEICLRIFCMGYRVSQEGNFE